MKQAEKLARAYEPSLWEIKLDGIRIIGCNPRARVDGLRLCVIHKFQKLIDSGLIQKE